MLKFVSFELVYELFFLLCCWEFGWEVCPDPLPLGIFEERLLDAEGIII